MDTITLTNELVIPKIMERIAADKQSYMRREFSSFSDLMEYIHLLKDDEYEKARHAMYYLFQSTYDLVQDGKHETLWAYKMVLEKGKQYFSSYYLNKPDIQLVRDLYWLSDFLALYDENYSHKLRGNFDAFSGQLNVDRVAEYLTKNSGLFRIPARAIAISPLDEATPTITS